MFTHFTSVCRWIKPQSIACVHPFVTASGSTPTRISTYNNMLAKKVFYFCYIHTIINSLWCISWQDLYTSLYDQLTFCRKTPWQRPSAFWSMTKYSKGYLFYNLDIWHNWAQTDFITSYHVNSCWLLALQPHAAYWCNGGNINSHLRCC